MTRPRDRLFQLLPEIYRARDLREGRPLEAMLSVFDDLWAELEADIDSLYSDLFIETCALDIVPYIGDLVGARLRSGSPLWPTMRGYAGNLIRFRRSKGTTATLVRAAQDISGSGVLVRDPFPALAATQDLRLLRARTVPRGAQLLPDLAAGPRGGGTIDLRDTAALARAGSPFDLLSRSPEIRTAASVRRTGDLRGRLGPGVIDLFVYRLGAYALTFATAGRPPQDREHPLPAGAYTLHPAGIDAPMFQVPVSPASEVSPMGGDSVPRPLDARDLASLLARRAAGDTLRVLLVPNASDPTHVQEVPPDQIVACDLGSWDARGAPGRVAIDPARGRLRLLGSTTAAEVRVSYAYGFSADMGGGPYARAVPALAGRVFLVGPFTNQADPDPAGVSRHPNVSDALAAFAVWRREALGKKTAAGDMRATVRITDSRTYTWSGNRAVPPSGWPTVDATGAHLVIEAADGHRPCLLGDLIVTGTTGARVLVSGLLWAGRAIFTGAMTVEIAHTTVRPGAPAPLPAAMPAPPSSPPGTAPPPGLQLAIRSSIVGGVRVARIGARVAIEDSIVDGSRAFRGLAPGADVLPIPPLRWTAILGETDGVHALCGSGFDPSDIVAPPCHLARTTVLGETVAAALSAEDVLFTGKVQAHATADGRLAHCHVPEGSVTPYRIHCTGGPGVAPRFTSLRWGHPAYAQLDDDTPAQIRTGAANGSEIGAFQRLLSPQRAALLRAALDDLVPLSLEPRTFHVT